LIWAKKVCGRTGCEGKPLRGYYREYAQYRGRLTPWLRFRAWVVCWRYIAAAKRRLGVAR